MSKGEGFRIWPFRGRRKQEPSAPREVFVLPKLRMSIGIAEGERVLRSPKGSREAVHDRFNLPTGAETFLPDAEGGILVAHNDELKYTRYVALEGNERVKFEAYLSDEALDSLRGTGWKTVRSLFENDFSNIQKEPFGSQSIDHLKDNWTSQRLRTVNKASQEAEQLLGVPVAIKGTGSGPFYDWQEHEDLTRQYLFMRKLGLSSERLPEDLKEILSVCKVYGVLRMPVDVPTGANEKQPSYHEWLIMERLVDAEPMETELKNHLLVGGGTESEAYFDPEKHPELVGAFSTYPVASGIKEGSFAALASSLVSLGLQPRLTDLAGRNMLMTKATDGKKHYTLIDQRPR